MKKLIVCITLLILLSGCVDISSSLYDDLDNYLDNLDYSFNIRSNHFAKYYSYYLPSDMSDEDGDESSAFMKYNDADIVMNLNISALVNSVSFKVNELKNDGFFKESLLIYERSGNFIKNDESYINYFIRVYQENNTYLIYLASDELNFYALCKKIDVLDTIKHIITIAKSTEIDRDSIVQDYSNKDVIESTKKQFNLFEYDIPASGFLSDLVNQTGNPTSGSEFEITIDDEVDDDYNEDYIPEE